MNLARAVLGGGAGCRLSHYLVCRQLATTHARARSSAKLEFPVGPICLDSLRVSDGPATRTLRSVGEVAMAARSEPSLLRILDTDKSGQLSRARDRLSTCFKKLRRTISEFRLAVSINESVRCGLPVHLQCPSVTPY